MKNLFLFILLCQMFSFNALANSQGSKGRKITYALKQPKHCKQKARYAALGGSKAVHGKSENRFAQPAKKAPNKK